MTAIRGLMDRARAFAKLPPLGAGSFTTAESLEAVDLDTVISHDGFWIDAVRAGLTIHANSPEHAKQPDDAITVPQAEKQAEADYQRWAALEVIAANGRASNFGGSPADTFHQT